MLPEGVEGYTEVVVTGKARQGTATLSLADQQFGCITAKQSIGSVAVGKCWCYSPAAAAAAAAGCPTVLSSHLVLCKQTGRVGICLLRSGA
jgi:hypothetical protein